MFRDLPIEVFVVSPSVTHPHSLTHSLFARNRRETERKRGEVDRDISKTKEDIITINQTVDYMDRAFMSFMRGVNITRAIGRVGLKVEPVLGTEIARATASTIWDQNRPLLAFIMSCRRNKYK